jgi:hypothetical protein
MFGTVLFSDLPITKTELSRSKCIRFESIDNLKSDSYAKSLRYKQKQSSCVPTSP